MRLDDLRRVLPLATTRVATVATAIAGVILLVLGRQLWRGKRAAWIVATLLLSGSVVLHVIKGLDVEEAIITAVLAGVLVWRRRDFFARSDPGSLARFFDTAPLLVAGAFIYGVAALWINHRSVHPSPSLLRALHETAAGLAGFSGPLVETGRFSRWFPPSLLAYGIGSFSFLTFLFFRPVVQRLQHHPGERALARDLVSAHDDDSLSYFTLRDDKDYFFNPERTAFLAYRYIAGVALISGDPIGPRDAWSALLAHFRMYAAERDWVVGGIGVGEQSRAVYESVGLRTMYIGDEAVIDVQAFSLEGRKIRNVRQSANHVKRAGYSVRVLMSKEVPEDVRVACRHISARWRGKTVERGFSMALGRMFSDDDPECIFAIAFDESERPRGFLHLAPYAQGRGYSLEAMRRDRETPGGLNELLIIEATLALQAKGVESFSLNFAAFAQGLARVKGFHPARRLWRRLLVIASRWFQIQSLLRFNRKFLPRWHQRYLAYEDPLDVPRVGLAVLAAEAFLRLPLVGRYF